MGLSVAILYVWTIFWSLLLMTKLQELGIQLHELQKQDYVYTAGSIDNDYRPVYHYNSVKHPARESMHTDGGTAGCAISCRYQSQIGPAGVNGQNVTISGSANSMVIINSTGNGLAPASGVFSNGTGNIQTSNSIYNGGQYAQAGTDVVLNINSAMTGARDPTRSTGRAVVADVGQLSINYMNDYGKVALHGNVSTDKNILDDGTGAMAVRLLNTTQLLVNGVNITASGTGVSSAIVAGSNATFNAVNASSVNTSSLVLNGVPVVSASYAQSSYVTQVTNTTTIDVIPTATVVGPGTAYGTNFVSQGGQLIITTQFAANLPGSSAQLAKFNLLLDGVVIETDQFYFNTVGNYFVIPMMTAVVNGIVAGSHTLAIGFLSGTACDGNGRATYSITETRNVTQQVNTTFLNSGVIAGGNATFTNLNVSTLNLNGAAIVSTSNAQTSFTSQLSNTTTIDVVPTGTYTGPTTAYTGTFTSSGGQLTLSASFAVFIPSSGNAHLAKFSLLLDGNPVDNDQMYINSMQIYTTLPTMTVSVSGIAAGVHTLAIALLTGTSCDFNGRATFVIAETRNITSQIATTLLNTGQYGINTQYYTTELFDNVAAQAALSNVTAVPLGWSKSYTGQGGIWEIYSSFSCAASAVGAYNFSLMIDGVAVDNVTHYFFAAGQNVAIPTSFHVNSVPLSGNHTIAMQVPQGILVNTYDTLNMVLNEYVAGGTLNTVNTNTVSATSLTTNRIADAGAKSIVVNTTQLTLAAKVNTSNNVLDDGSGNMQVNGALSITSPSNYFNTWLESRVSLLSNQPLINFFTTLFSGGPQGGLRALGNGTFTQFSDSVNSYYTLLDIGSNGLDVFTNFVSGSASSINYNRSQVLNQRTLHVGAGGVLQTFANGSPRVTLDNGAGFTILPQAVYLAQYGSATYYQYGSSTGSSSQSTMSAYYYMTLPTSTAVNFPVKYTGTAGLIVPYTGIYTISFSISNLGSGGAYELFISKNLQNGNDININNDQLVALTNSLNTEGTISGTSLLNAGDFINCGIYVGSSGSLGNNGRNRITIALMQRTA